MISNIRKPEWFDVNGILDVDLKCFDDPWDSETWRNILENNEIHVLIALAKSSSNIAYGAFVVGFIVWTNNRIIKLGVRPSYRRKGCSKQLLNAVSMALISSSFTTLEIKVPESLCNPKYPDTLNWLKSQGFKATGLLENSIIYCGTFEDEYVFQKELIGIKL